MPLVKREVMVRISDVKVYPVTDFHRKKLTRKGAEEADLGFKIETREIEVAESNLTTREKMALGLIGGEAKKTSDGANGDATKTKKAPAAPPAAKKAPAPAPAGAPAPAAEVVTVPAPAAPVPAVPVGDEQIDAMDEATLRTYASDTLDMTLPPDGDLVTLKALVKEAQ